LAQNDLILRTKGVYPTEPKRLKVKRLAEGGKNRWAQFKITVEQEKKYMMHCLLQISVLNPTQTCAVSLAAEPVPG